MTIGKKNAHIWFAVCLHMWFETANGECCSINFAYNNDALLHSVMGFQMKACCFAYRIHIRSSSTTVMSMRYEDELSSWICGELTTLQLTAKSHRYLSHINNATSYIICIRFSYTIQRHCSKKKRDIVHLLWLFAFSLFIRSFVSFTFPVTPFGRWYICLRLLLVMLFLCAQLTYVNSVEHILTLSEK